MGPILKTNKFIRDLPIVLFGGGHLENNQLPTSSGQILLDLFSVDEYT